MKTINLRDAIYMLHDAWTQVKQPTIVNCYAKAGFEDPEAETVNDECNTIHPPKNMTPEQFEEAVNQDADLPVCGELTDEELMTEVKRRRLNEQDFSEDDQDDEKTEDVTTKEIHDAVCKIRTFLQLHGLESSRRHFLDIEDDINLNIQLKKRQTTITAFFKPS